jgi:hypothetical protein
MRKICVLLSLALASSAMATITFSVVPNAAAKTALDAAGPGFATSEFFVFDVMFQMTPDDDWTSTHMFGTIDAGDPASFIPRLAQLKAPLNPDPDVDPPLTAAQSYGNMASTPNDWPNVTTPGSPGSSLATVGTTVSMDKSLEVTWFDTATNNGASFVGFRLTLRQLKAEEDLTLSTTTDLVATYTSTTTTVLGGGSLTSFGFSVYRVPEPATLGVLALGGLASLLRRR